MGFPSRKIFPPPPYMPPGTILVREGFGPLELPIVPDGMYGGCGTIFAAENPIFQSKNRFLAVFAPGNLKDFSKNW